MSKKLVIIGKDDCSFCKNAVNMSNARKLDFEYLNVPNDLSLEEAYKKSEKFFTTFPMIYIEENGKMIEQIGGFTELRKSINKLNI